MLVNFTSEGSQGEYQVILKEVWMSVVEHGACQEQLRRTRLGSFFQLDQESFICAGGQVDRDMCTVSWKRTFAEFHNHRESLLLTGGLVSIDYQVLCEYYSPSPLPRVMEAVP